MQFVFSNKRRSWFTEFVKRLRNSFHSLTSVEINRLLGDRHTKMFHNEFTNEVMTSGIVDSLLFIPGPFMSSLLGKVFQLSG